MFQFKLHGYDPYAFEPREDITAYELAQIMKNAAPGPASNLSVINFTPEQFASLPSGVARHFRKA